MGPAQRWRRNREKNLQNCPSDALKLPSTAHQDDAFCAIWSTVPSDHCCAANLRAVINLLLETSLLQESSIHSLWKSAIRSTWWIPLLPERRCFALTIIWQAFPVVCPNRHTSSSAGEKGKLNEKMRGQRPKRSHIFLKALLFSFGPKKKVKPDASRDWDIMVPLPLIIGKGSHLWGPPIPWHRAGEEKGNYSPPMWRC